MFTVHCAPGWARPSATEDSRSAIYSTLFAVYLRLLFYAVYAVYAVYAISSLDTG